MRLLGRSSLSVYRLDLVFLRASLLADDRPEVAALASEPEALLTRLREERDAIEAAQDAAVVMSARRSRRDDAADRKIVSFGGQVRAVDKKLYARFFPTLSPTEIARGALDRQMREMERLLGEVATLPEDDALRVAHESGLRGALEALRLAKKEREDVDVSLALARSQLEAFRAEVDRARVALFGKLTALLGSKSEADEFFRSADASDDAATLEAPASSAAR